MERIPRRAGYFWTINLALITVAAFLIADIITLLISQRLKVPVLQTIATGPRADSDVDYASPERPSVVLASIVQSGVFGRPTEKAALMDLSGSEGWPLMKPLKVRLVGTIVGTPPHALAILEDPLTQEQTLYRLNDRISGGGQIVAIERNKIKVNRGGYLETLEVSLAGPTSSEPSGGASAVEAGSSKRLFLDRREVSAGFENLGTLMTKARVFPHVTDGKTDGFVIQDIVPGSLFERIGLRNNDIVRRINGIEVKDPETFFKILLGMRHETAISLDLVRGSRLETYAYEIR